MGKVLHEAVDVEESVPRYLLDNSSGKYLPTSPEFYVQLKWLYFDVILIETRIYSWVSLRFFDVILIVIKNTNIYLGAWDFE